MPSVKRVICNCSATTGTFSFTETYDPGKIKKKDADSYCNSTGASWIVRGCTCKASQD